MIKQSILIISLVVAASSCTAQNASGLENKNAQEVIELSENKSLVMIDVRTPGEVANGYLKGTDHFFDIGASSFAENINSLDRTKTYVLICQSGARSQRAARYMLENGFSHVINMSGGMRVVRNPDYITK